MSKCPCGSNKEFDDCCNRYISEKLNAPMPEDLMRSRYSAYTQANILYIQKTMCGKAAKNYDENSALDWARNTEWLGLSVLKSEMQTSEIGFVEFVARYKYNGINQQIHERSEFLKIKDKWYYVDGVIF